MTYQEFEEIFNRAWMYSFSRKKWLLLFPTLLICGLIVIFCRALAIDANPWVEMSLSFLPVFLCTGILLGVGSLLVRLYYHEIKKSDIPFYKVVLQSFEVLVGASYLALPLILSYVVVWALMGIFHLLKALPVVGESIGVLLTLGPFLLVLASVCLSVLSLFLLFFVTPHVALKSQMGFHILEEVIDRMKTSVFTNILLFLVASVPLLFSGLILIWSAILTGTNYMTTSMPLFVSLQWFFIMIPFSLILTPFLVFFFNFATESFGVIQRRRRRQVSGVKEEVS